VTLIAEFVLMYILVDSHWGVLDDKYKKVSLFKNNLSFSQIKSHPIHKLPVRGIGIGKKNNVVCGMNLLSEALKNFWEGFRSFFVSIYNQMKTW